MKLLLLLSAALLLTSCGKPQQVPERPLHAYQVTYASGAQDTIYAASFFAQEAWGKLSFVFYTNPYHVVAHITQPATVKELP